MSLTETNRYHFADVTVDLADRTSRQLAVKVDGIRGARDVQRLQRLALPDAKTRTARRVARGLSANAPDDDVLDADETRLKALLDKHQVEPTAIIRKLDRVRRRIQLDQDPKQGHAEPDLDGPAPAALPGQLRDVYHAVAIFTDGQTEVFEPMTRLEARVMLGTLRAQADVTRAYVCRRVVTEEDVTAEL